MRSTGGRFAVGGLLTATLLLTACGPRYPLGIPEEQWTHMSPAERTEARVEQAKLDQARAEARRQEAAAREAEAAARAAELAHARANAGPGERVQCILQPVEMYYAGEWRAAEPLGLDLVAGMRIGFELQARENHYRRIEGHATFDGMEVRLCPEYGDDCARFLATTGELLRGVNRQVAADDLLRGRMHCELAYPGYRHFP